MTLAKSFHSASTAAIGLEARLWPTDDELGFNLDALWLKGDATVSQFVGSQSNNSVTTASTARVATLPSYRSALSQSLLYGQELPPWTLSFARCDRRILNPVSEIIVA